MAENNMEMGDIEMEEKKGLSGSDSSGTTQSSSEKSKANIFIRILIFPVVLLSLFFSKHIKMLRIMFFTLLIIGYIVYFIIALTLDATAAIPLVIFTCVILFIVLYELFMRHCFERIAKPCRQRKVDVEQKNKINRYLTYAGLLAAVAFTIWLVVDVTQRNPSQLISLLGFVIILLVCVGGSKYPEHINWRPVIWGIALQFILGLLVLRTTFGYSFVKFIGDQVATFMKYTDVGSQFVFGKGAEGYLAHFFAFTVLPTIVFFSTVMNMLYYIGVMQWFIGKLSYLMQITLGTSAIESTVSVANIFVGMTEAPLVVRPYLPDLTKAEIHSVLTSGLGSIAFSVFGAFVAYGVDKVHLLTACVMSAPGSLVVSRMLYPEKEVSNFHEAGALSLVSGSNRNIVEAAAAGASMSIKLVANIAANLIAFLALLALVNSTLAWFGAFVGEPALSFEMICSYLFMPVAFVMGADWEDCFLVGQLFGMKTFLNEFVAYESMKPFIDNRLNRSAKFDLDGNILRLSERSEVVAIHALCGFCNVSSLGIIIGGLSTLMPTRRNDLAAMAVRALIGGMLTCCMTASIAGLLFIETPTLPASNITLAMNTTGLLTTVPSL